MDCWSKLTGPYLGFEGHRYRHGCQVGNTSSKRTHVRKRRRVADDERRFIMLPYINTVLLFHVNVTKGTCCRGCQLMIWALEVTLWCWNNNNNRTHWWNGAKPLQQISIHHPRGISTPMPQVVHAPADTFDVTHQKRESVQAQKRCISLSHEVSKQKRNRYHVISPSYLMHWINFVKKVLVDDIKEE